MFDAYFNFILGILCGAALMFAYLRRNYRIEPHWTFSWGCDSPGCKFKIATMSDDPNLLLRIVDQHKESHNV